MNSGELALNFGLNSYFALSLKKAQGCCTLETDDHLSDENCRPLTSDFFASDCSYLEED